METKQKKKTGRKKKNVPHRLVGIYKHEKLEKEFKALAEEEFRTFSGHIQYLMAEKLKREKVPPYYKDPLTIKKELESELESESDKLLNPEPKRIGISIPTQLVDDFKVIVKKRDRRTSKHSIVRLIKNEIEQKKNEKKNEIKSAFKNEDGTDYSYLSLVL